MFIIVPEYKRVDYSKKDRVLVLDTNDLSVEYTTRTKMDKAGINYFESTLFDCLRRVDSNSRICIFVDGRNISLDWKVFIDCDMKYDRNFWINGTKICDSYNHRIEYVFAYKRLYIVRAVVNTEDEGDLQWVSAAINDKGDVVSYWDTEFKNTKNPEVGRRIDRLLKY